MAYCEQCRKTHLAINPIHCTNCLRGYCQRCGDRFLLDLFSHESSSLIIFCDVCMHWREFAQFLNESGGLSTLLDAYSKHTQAKEQARLILVEKNKPLELQKQIERSKANVIALENELTELTKQ